MPTLPAPPVHSATPAGSLAIFRISLIATLAACAMLTIGGLVTTNTTLTAPLESFWLSAKGHQRIAEMAGTFTLLFLIWAGLKSTTPSAKKAAWVTAAALITTGALGFLRGEGYGVPPQFQAWIGTFHATLAQIIVAGTLLTGLLNLPAFMHPNDPVEDYGWPSNRSMGAALPYLVLTQVFLGAAYRQGALGLMLHVLGAMAVAVFILMAGAFALHQYPKHKVLARTARAMLGVTAAQVFFGIGAFTVRTLPENAMSLMIFTGVHVVIGALTLAASLAMSLAVRTYVVPKGRLQSSPK